MATLLVDSVKDSSGNHYGRRSGNILQTRFYEYSAVFEDTSQNTQRELPGILGNGLAGITMHGTNNHVLCEATIQLGQNSTWRHNAFRQYYRINQGSWTFHNNGGLLAYSYVENYSGMLRSTKVMTILDPGTLTVGDTIYFKYTYQGHQNGGYLHLNKNSSNNSSSNQNNYSVASTIQLSEIYRTS